MIEFRVEKNPIRLMQKHIHLLDEQKDELNRYGDEWKLEPDWVRYRNLFEGGNTLTVGAWKGEELVGYTVNILFRHLHYNFVMAYNDIIYLKKEYRGHGIRLIKFTECELKKLGVDIFNISVKPHVDFSGVLKRFGYKLIEHDYARRL